MKTKTVILAYFTTVLCCTSAGLFSPVVQTNSGKVEGVRSLSDLIPAKMYLGIPFAKPPLGNLRFLKPQPVEPWSGTLKATKQPPACIQYSPFPFPTYDDMPGQSEDCLYLNIYTPYLATKRSNYPVLFWIYGGGFIVGSNRLDVYDGRVLAHREGVIVVTINYRLGVLGFLTSNSSDAPGNAALYDTLMALQWVNDNIEHFGGDKNRITIAGESAGSIAVSVLCVSPLTKGLFSRAILESATLIMQRYDSRQSNLDLSEQVAEAVKCATKDFTIYDHPTKVVECLRQKNATYLEKTMASIGRGFFEQYGDSLLPNNAIDDIKNGNFHNVPILAGNVQDEGSYMITIGNIEEFGFFGKKNLNPHFNKTYASTLLQGRFSNSTDTQKYADYYLKDVPDNDYVQIRNQVINAFSDAAILCSTVFFAESYAVHKNDAYFYFFTHRPSNTPFAKWMGVLHFEEVQFVFGRPVRVPKDYTSDEVRLSRKMMKLWGNFVKKGNPGSYPKWPKYSNESHTYFTLGVKNYGKLGTGPHLENCNFLRSYFNF